METTENSKASAMIMATEGKLAEVKAKSAETETETALSLDSERRPKVYV